MGHGGRLVLDFSRLYDTCDNDDYMIDVSMTHVIMMITMMISHTGINGYVYFSFMV